MMIMVTSLLHMTLNNEQLHTLMLSCVSLQLKHFNCHALINANLQALMLSRMRLLLKIQLDATVRLHNSIPPNFLKPSIEKCQLLCIPPSSQMQK